MKKERFEKITQILEEANAVDRFNWHAWGANQFEKITIAGHSCGTSACVAGWALVEEFGGSSFGYTQANASSRGVEDYTKFFAEWLGVSKSESNFICYPGRNHSAKQMTRGYDQKCIDLAKSTDFETAMHRLNLVRSVHEAKGDYK